MLEEVISRQITCANRHYLQIFEMERTTRTSSWNGTRRGPSEFDPSEHVLEINDREGSASALRDRQCITITEVGDTSPT